MKKLDFKKLISEKKLILDGATGSNLFKAGMPKGVCPEKWILENPEVMSALQLDYIEAGTDILYAPTFSGNRIKLSEYGLEDDLISINKGLVELTRKSIEKSGTDKKIYIAGDLTMTGKQVYPLGDLMFEELVDIYKEQIRVLHEAGVDMLVVETMMSLQECRAALIAAGECCDLPVMITMTFNEDGRALFGTSPEAFALCLSRMGADAIGINCSTGPEKMVPLIEKMKAYTSLPIIIKPNAGMPVLADGETVYPMTPKEFASEMEKIVEAGADILGGCCGTTPEHIRVLCETLGDKIYDVAYKERSNVKRRVLSTERNVLDIELNGRFMVIGERINPTGKKNLQEELRNGSLDLVGQMAESEVMNGADILDVNMGTNGIDETEMMIKAIYELTTLTDAPLSIDSSNPDVIEAALRIYPGRALINSISLEDGKCERLLPLAKKYGAMFILLPLNSAGLPKDLDEKKDNIRVLLERAEAAGLSREDMIIDGLVATIGANKFAALETLETIKYAKDELHIATACGLSNISFGLPDRMFVNSNFLAMAVLSGLTMAIVNPSQELLMHAVMAADLLAAKEGSDIRYIERAESHKISVIDGTLSDYAGADGKIEAKGKVEKKGAVSVPKEFEDDELFLSVIKGKKDRSVALVNEILSKEGKDPKEILDSTLIPAITHVGELYEAKIYYLPQLIAAAEAMSSAVEVIEPLLASGEEKASYGTVIIATVEHDIHDIGKNLVALMLKNYGFNVYDLGKDVPAEEIVERAKEEDADIIALSALMTTTMMEMKKVVSLRNEMNIRAKVMIGGACITESFAKEIGADGYSEDAQEAVGLAKKLCEG